MCTRSNLRIIALGIMLCFTLIGCANTSVIPPTPPPTATGASTAQTLPTQYPYPPYTGKLVMNDPLKDNSRGYKWDETTIGTANCGFLQGAYHVRAEAQGAIICNPEAPALFLKNFAFQISLKVVQGEIAGIAFRFNQTNSTGYVFFLDTRQGNYSFSAANGNSTQFRPISIGSSNAIIKGLNQSNLLAVVTDNNKINLYVNHQLVIQANDDSYSQGQLGIFTTDIQSPADVEASSASAWTF